METAIKNKKDEPVEKNKKINPVLLILGSIAVFGVPLAFTIFGWLTVSIDCVRQEQGAAPSCEVQNGYLFGLVKTEKRHLNHVTAIGYSTSTMSTGGTARRPVSTVVMSGPEGKMNVFKEASNVNDKEKKMIIRQTEAFLADREKPSLRIAMSFSNLFGWISLPFVLLILWSVAYSIVRFFFPKQKSKTQ